MSFDSIPYTLRDLNEVNYTFQFIIITPISVSDISVSVVISYKIWHLFNGRNVVYVIFICIYYTKDIHSLY